MNWEDATLYTADTSGAIVARVQYDRQRHLMKVVDLHNPQYFGVGAQVGFWERGRGRRAPMFHGTITRHISGSPEGAGGLYEFEEFPLR